MWAAVSNVLQVLVYCLATVVCIFTGNSVPSAGLMLI